MTSRAKGAAQSAPAVRSRSGKHVAPRVEFHAPAHEVDLWRAEADEGGITLSEWVREACRAYRLLSGKDDALTDAEWQEVMRGDYES